MHTWVHNIKIHLKEIGWEDVGWVDGLRLGMSGRLLRAWYRTLRFHKVWGIS